jgi:hypothetical protein
MTLSTFSPKVAQSCATFEVFRFFEVIPMVVADVRYGS